MTSPQLATVHIQSFFDVVQWAKLVTNKSVMCITYMYLPNYLCSYPPDNHHSSAVVYCRAWDNCTVSSIECWCTLTWKDARFWLRWCIPDVPVTRVLLKRHDDAVKVGQLVQLGDVVPGRLRQPRARIVHLIVFVQHLSIPTDHSMLQSLSQYAPQLFTATA